MHPNPVPAGERAPAPRSLPVLHRIQSALHLAVACLEAFDVVLAFESVLLHLSYLGARFPFLGGLRLQIAEDLVLSHAQELDPAVTLSGCGRQDIDHQIILLREGQEALDGRKAPQPFRQGDLIARPRDRSPVGGDQMKGLVDFHCERRAYGVVRTRMLLMAGMVERWIQKRFLKCAQPLLPDVEAQGVRQPSDLDGRIPKKLVEVHDDAPALLRVHKTSEDVRYPQPAGLLFREPVADLERGRNAQGMPDRDDVGRLNAASLENLFPERQQQGKPRVLDAEQFG